MTGPYAQAWEAYRAAGWTGIIPLPPRKKASPPRGVTGPDGIWPSYADCMTWAEGREGAGNIALHLPPGFLGIDVDDYDGKPGAATLADAETRWGPLPATWKSSSRAGLSGIRFFRVPEGLAWPGQVGPGIETVHTAHRYAVVWPSEHPDTSSTYQWANPTGQPCGPPDVDQLPELPTAWVQGLTAGREQAAPGARNNWDNQQVQAWLIDRPRAFDGLCLRMAAAVNAARLALAAGAGSHDTTTSGVMRVVRLADDGHAGLLPALGDLHAAFVATRAYRTGAGHDAHATEAEWRRGLQGAVSKVSATSTGLDVCDCDGRLTNAIVAASGPPQPPAQPNPTQYDQTQPNPAQPEPPQPPPPLDPFIEDQIRTETLKLKIRDEARRRVRREHTAAQTPPDLTPLDQFLAVQDEPQRYRIEGLWPVGGRVMLTAQFKSGKTTLVGNLVRSLADGDPFLERFLVHQPDGGIVIIDNELDDRMLRRWMRDQNITNTAGVTVLPLRGRLSTFDIIDPDTRTEWANKLRHINTKVAIIDCLAPLLDSLGLSEDKEAGQFLIALDELAKEAGIEELVLVHHMGHNGERARGASRLRDWPDVEWRLVREKTEDEDPSARRFFSAYGRDVDVAEAALEYHPATRGLALTGGSRADAADDEVKTAIFAYLTKNPGSTGRQIELFAGHPQKKTRHVLKGLAAAGSLHVLRHGPALHYTLPVESIANPRLTSGNTALPNAPSIAENRPGTPDLSANTPHNVAELKPQVNGTSRQPRQTSATSRQQGDEALGNGPSYGGGPVLPRRATSVPGPAEQTQTDPTSIEARLQRAQQRSTMSEPPPLDQTPAWTAAFQLLADHTWHPWAQVTTHMCQRGNIKEKAASYLLSEGIRAGHLKWRGEYDTASATDKREIAIAGDQ